MFADGTADCTVIIMKSMFYLFDHLILSHNNSHVHIWAEQLEIRYSFIPAINNMMALNYC